ncbi:unnamed protein product [Polarella glacialis]|uniref:DUF6815 domain-containing protein n=1 Tax=Polarella glacialis TaxID=89957 RepID=A0A813ELY3_POLGL|nr:unnamed protein product [Polarella glacialis]
MAWQLPMARAELESLLPQPEAPKYKLAVIGFTAPGGWEMNTDKDKTGVRYDSTAIANGVIVAGGSCVLFDYTPDDHDGFAAKVAEFAALIVRINPGQLSAPGVKEGAQLRFDGLMRELVAKKVPVWSSPGVQTQMGAKDALTNIRHLSCGLPDTYTYFGEDSGQCAHFVGPDGMRKTCAFQPRVIKQNRGSAGEGIWLVWLVMKDGKKIKKADWAGSKLVEQEKNGKKTTKCVPVDDTVALAGGGGLPPYCASLGAELLDDDDMIKLMEMNDNHVEYHSLGEFMSFCVDGSKAEAAGDWKATFPGQYFKGGKEAGGQLVDQRLLPRIEEGEVRMQMVGDRLFKIIHKLPVDGLSAVGGNNVMTFYEPGPKPAAPLEGVQYAADKPELVNLEMQFVKKDIPVIMPALGLGGEPLPLLWTGDFIPKNTEESPDGSDGKTDFVVGEFNCSCVGISPFGAACGPDKDLKDVPEAEFRDGYELTCLMGSKALEMLAAL